MNILALDLGTKTGYALHTPDGTMSGEWNLAGNRFSGGGWRYLNFRQHLAHMCKDCKVEMVVYEIVRRHLGTDAAHAYGGYLATMTTFCEGKTIPYRGFNVGAIKKNWTGKGNASKKQMIHEAEGRGCNIVSDNQVDALAILDLALKGQE